MIEQLAKDLSTLDPDNPTAAEVALQTMTARVLSAEDAQKTKVESAVARMFLWLDATDGPAETGALLDAVSWFLSCVAVYSERQLDGVKEGDEGKSVNAPSTETMQ